MFVELGGPVDKRWREKTADTRQQSGLMTAFSSSIHFMINPDKLEWDLVVGTKNNYIN